MALINLKLIGQLEELADVGEALALSKCYNVAGRSELPPTLFVTLIKRAKQAYSLFERLKGIHRVTTDFANGNFQPYIDDYENEKGDSEKAFDPFDELTYQFSFQSITNLPVNIEQYSELVDFVAGFSSHRRKLDAGIDQTFGHLIQYRVEDGEGQEFLISHSELPTDLVDTMNAERGIQAINVDYCLDGYNEFYGQLTGLIAQHRPQGTIVECAEAILLLFSPYDSQPTNIG